MIQAVNGLSLGYFFKPEIKMPGLDIFQAFALSECLQQYPIPRVYTYIPYLPVPLYLMGSSIKEGTYRKYASLFHLPTNQTAVKICRSVAENWSRATHAAMVAGSLGLIALGKVPFGAGMLGALGYHHLNEKGLIDKRINAFVQTYMPVAAQVGLLFTGPLPLRILTGVSLLGALMLPTSVNKIDTFCRKIFRIPDFPLLSEFQAPLEPKKELTLQDIEAVLDPSNGLAINPAHCSKPLSAYFAFDEDKELSRYLTYFDQIDWRAQYSEMISDIVEDTLFIDFLMAKCPERNLDDIMENGQTCFEELAAKEQTAPWKYLRTFLRKRMENILANLKDPGSAAKLLYLVPKMSLRQRAAFFSMMAIKGGQLTAPQVETLFDKWFFHALKELAEKVIKDSDKRREVKIVTALQECREMLVMTKGEEPKMWQRPELTEIEKKYFSLGFLPPEEKEETNSADAYLWNFHIATGLIKIYDAYKKSGLQTALHALEERDLAKYKFKLAKKFPQFNNLTNQELIKLMLVELRIAYPKKAI